MSEITGHLPTQIKLLLNCFNTLIHSPGTKALQIWDILTFNMNMCAIEDRHNATAILIMALVLLPLILWQILAVYYSPPNPTGTRSVHYGVAIVISVHSAYIAAYRSISSPF